MMGLTAAASLQKTAGTMSRLGLIRSPAPSMGRMKTTAYGVQEMNQTQVATMQTLNSFCSV